MRKTIKIFTYSFPGFDDCNAGKLIAQTDSSAKPEVKEALLMLHLLNL
jgi:hypothetical protein